MSNVISAVASIVAKRRHTDRARSILVGITGIDGSGKGYMTAQIAAQLQERKIHFAAINVDGWLNLPFRCFNPDDPAQLFYDNAIRFEEMFARLILPQKENRSHRLAADLADATDAETYHRHVYTFAVSM
jgi:uridine kinase